MFSLSKDTFLLENFKKSLLSVEGPNVQKISIFFFKINSNLI
tara:strand:- start:387 stop:512 length:126 start_codon:yes stop_codon:yes gene_type:complete